MASARPAATERPARRATGEAQAQAADLRRPGHGLARHGGGAHPDRVQGAHRLLLQSDRDGGETHYKEWLSQKINSNPYSAVHVYLDGKIIGQMELGKIKTEPEVGMVNLYYLAPEFRGKSLSSYLDQYAIKFLKEQGYKIARLNVSPTNLRAVRFYSKNGWRDVGPNPKYPEVHTMEKNLDLENQ